MPSPPGPRADRFLEQSEETANALEPTKQRLIRAACYATGYAYPTMDVARYVFAQHATLDASAFTRHGAALPSHVNSLFAQMLYLKLLVGLASLQVGGPPSLLKECVNAETEWARKTVIRLRGVADGMRREIEAYYNRVDASLMVTEVQLGLREDNEAELMEKYGRGYRGR